MRGACVVAGNLALKSATTTVCRWYDTNAAYIWGAARPSYHEVQRHANCMKALDLDKLQAKLEKVSLRAQRWAPRTKSLLAQSLEPLNGC